LIDPIEVNEASDPEIEEFLAEEDLDCQRFDPAHLYDFVNNIPPCLEGKDGFTSIRFCQGHVKGSIDTTRLDCTLHQHIVSLVQCEVFLHWIERYYTDIPILQAQIKTLTTHNELLRKENIDLKENEERQAKHLKKTSNIVIRNTDILNAIINSELFLSMFSHWLKW
jgi:hypothetical protein